MGLSSNTGTVPMWGRSVWGLLALMLLPALQGCSPVLIAGGAIGAGTAVVLDRRTPGAMIEDQTIEIGATDAIYRDEAVGKRVHIRVTSFNKIVLLSGEAPTAAARDRVLEIVSKVPNIKGVLNEVQLSRQASLARRAGDTALTAAVKTRLMTEKAQPIRTKVVTSRGTVYLMGLLTRAEAEKAARAAARVKGVKQVVKSFEYLDLDGPDSVIVRHGERATRVSGDNTEKKEENFEDADVIPYDPAAMEPMLSGNK